MSKPSRLVCLKVYEQKKTRNITRGIKKMYRIYFVYQLGEQDKTQIPYKVCKKCCLDLHNWINKRSSLMPFAVPMIWREPKDHCRNCYFWSHQSKGLFFKQRDKKACSNLDSARSPVPHDKSIPPSEPP